MEKPRYDLLPFDVLDQVAKAFAHGAEKHGDFNWRDEPTDQDEHFDAALRHLSAWKQNRLIDPDSGEHTLAHVIARVMILAGLENMALCEIERRERMPVGQWPEWADTPTN